MLAGDVTWGPTRMGLAQPNSPAAGKVSGSGTYHLDGGFNVTEMTIYADPVLGGTSGSNPCVYNSPPDFSGSIVGLPAGDYNVHVHLKGTKPGLIVTTEEFSSTTVVVTVK